MQRYHFCRRALAKFVSAIQNLGRPCWSERQRGGEAVENAGVERGARRLCGRGAEIAVGPEVANVLDRRRACWR